MKMNIITNFSTKSRNESDYATGQNSHMYETLQKETEFISKQFWFRLLSGNVWLKMKEYEFSFFNYQILLGILLSRDREFDDDGYFCTVCYSGLGFCLLNMNEHVDALSYLKIAIKFIRSYEIVDIDYFPIFSEFDAFKPEHIVVNTYHHVGKCLMELHQFEEALPYLFEALDIVTNGNFCNNDQILIDAAKTHKQKKRVKNLANILRDLGLFYMKQNCFDESVSYLQRAFNIYKELFETKNIAETRFELLTCFMEIYQRERVEEQLNVV